MQPVSPNAGLVDTCGMPIAGGNPNYLDLDKRYFIQKTVNAGQVLADQRQVIDVDEFRWRGIMMPNVVNPTAPANGARIRFRLPDGRYLSNVRIPITYAFTGGNFGRTFCPQLPPILKGQRISYELEVTAAVGAPYTFVFTLVGVERIYFNQ